MNDARPQEPPRERPAAPSRHGEGRAPEAARPAPVAPAREEKPVLPDRSPDDSDVGWGERGGGERDDDWDDWYERERPPHW